MLRLDLAHIMSIVVISDRIDFLINATEIIGHLASGEREVTLELIRCLPDIHSIIVNNILKHYEQDVDPSMEKLRI